MSLQTSLDLLSQLAGQFESHDRTVRDVEVTARDGATGVVHASMDVPLSLCPSPGECESSDISPESATLTGDGGLQVEFSVSEVLPTPEPTGPTVAVTEQDVRIDDGELRLSVDLAIEPSEEIDGAPAERDAATGSTDADGAADEPPSSSESEPAESTPADELRAVRDTDVPPYEDTEYLQALYDTCDNFIEMSERIEMDVSSETVRRYMVDAGVHEPATYDTAADETQTEDEPAPAQSPTPGDRIPDEQLVTDGLGLPAEVRLKDVAEAVSDSVTVYEVQRSLGLERQQTQALLKELDLLDLVMRPLAGNPEQPASYDEVVSRLQNAVPGSASA